MESFKLYGVILIASVSTAIITLGLLFIAFSQAPPLEDLGVAKDFVLVDENNQSVTLDSYKDRVIFLAFIYTSCPDALFCPLTTSKMKDLQNRLVDAGYNSNDFHLLSISFDWRYDNVTKMKTYGTNYNADFSSWSFLSGNKTQVEGVLTSYGVFTFDTEDPSDTFIIHNLKHVIIDKESTIRADYTDNSWKVADAFDLVKRLI